MMKDPGLLEAALEGLLLQRDRIETQIREIRAMIGRRTGPGTSAAPPSAAGAASKRKRSLSEAARKRIAAAQKKRWAEYRKQTKEPKAGKQARAAKEAK